MGTVDTALITLYDCDNDGAGIPANAQAVAGYGDGGNYATLVARFPHAHHLLIATHPSVDGDCLDVERGDSAPADVPGWVHRQAARGVHRPVIYGSVATYMPAVLAELHAAKIPLASVRLWVAHWGAPPVVPAGFDAIQYRQNGFAFDESVCLPDFFSPAPPIYPTLTGLQKASLDEAITDLGTVIAWKGQLDKKTFDTLRAAQARVAAVK